ncbi:MAG TPA: tripartite tricarboxylate transporter substrate-binding protein [Verrucomicrobiae bacterium]|nr:tripartite tricarboxylate transporter substrate-binding protein [Verrucomicrobiae bacterium]
MRRRGSKFFGRRRNIFLLVTLIFGAVGPGAGCQKQNRSDASYPNRSINLIVPWAAGGGTDRVARFVAGALQRRLSQPVIVINRTGGSGAVGHSAGALAAPDGHTLTMATFELSTMHSMGISKLTWEDFTPVAQLNGDAAAILVRQDAPWKNLAELHDVIRKEPGRLKMSGTATGGAWDLARSGLLIAAGIPTTSVIWAPTQGSAPALVELLGGHVDVVCCSVPEAASQIEGGQVRVLAVLGPERLADFPDHPTAREQGVAYDAVGWRGIMLPKGAPPQIAQLLNEKLAEIAASDEFRQFMKKNGFAVMVRGPEQFAAFLRAEHARWRDVIRNAGYETLGQNHDPGPRAMPLALTLLIVVAILAESLRSRRSRFEDRTRSSVLGSPFEPLNPLTRPSDTLSPTGGEGRGEGASRPQDRFVVMGGATIPVEPGGTRLSADALFLLVALVTYLIAMRWIGFSGSTFVFALAVMRRLGTKWWLAGVGSAVIVVAIHLLFVTLFKVQLP